MSTTENSNDQQKPKQPFDELGDINSTPTLPFTEVQKVRFSEVAKDLEDARIQGYIESNFGYQALQTLQAVIPLLVTKF